MSISSDDDSMDGVQKKNTKSDSSLNTDTNGDGSGDSGSNVDEEKEIKDGIIRHEERSVRNIRIFVGLFIVVCAAAIGGAIYYFAKQADYMNFYIEYETITSHMKDLVVWETRYNFALMEQLSASVTTSALNTKSEFPFFTMNEYEITGGYVDGLGGIIMTAYAPLIIGDAMRYEWQQYAQDHRAWMLESERLKRVSPGHLDPLHGTIQDHEHGETDRMRRLQTINATMMHSITDVVFDLVNQTTEEDTVEEAAVEDDKYHTNASLPDVPLEIFHWVDGVKTVEPYDPEIDNNTITTPDGKNRKYLPLWQASPWAAKAVNTNLFSGKRRIWHLFEEMLKTNKTNLPIMSGDFVLDEKLGWIYDSKTDQEWWMNLPHAYTIAPVYKRFEYDPELTGIVVGVTAWHALLDKLLAEGTEGIVCVIEDTCGDPITYELNGRNADFIGRGDFHDPDMDVYRRTAFNIEQYDLLYNVTDVCHRDLHIFPSTKFIASYQTNKPAIYASIVVLAFVVMSMLLIVYDIAVTRRQDKTMRTAARTQAIVQSLFPKDVGKQLIKEAHEKYEENKNKTKGFTGKAGLKSLMDEGMDQYAGGIGGSKPLADLFPNTTVMFADLVGFTAWSSMREPTQVFTLLETIYGAFDEIAKQRRVFKVETVGDCYVAVAGLPDPRKDHAVCMARFARDCLYKMNVLRHDLEVELGPDTAELGMRFGLHSGPVTAGVLRGERARFQLFGDTVNTTARIESTGKKDKIHISKETADLLVSSSKGHWVRAREDLVQAKGKGTLQTFWLDVKGDVGRSTSSGDSESRHSSLPVQASVQGEVARDQGIAHPEKHSRLVDWNAEIMARSLRDIIARRYAEETRPDIEPVMRRLELEQLETRITVLEEVQDVIKLPKFNLAVAKRQDSLGTVVVSDTVKDQLRSFIQVVASMYRDNAFHNFEHASHVTMSVVKLLSRIVAPDIEYEKEDVAEKQATLHDHTYGLTSCPLTQFAVIFSALIHDVDHPGVPNFQLIKEQATTAAVYKNKSVAEQNSVDLAWELLMHDSYVDLRRSIYANKREFKLFRQLVVNIVMATDIMDKELSTARKARWNMAFENDGRKETAEALDSVDRKATIVLEHIIQASDVAHTMQHWHIYRKWNARLFQEMYQAYLDGRAENNPADNWYKGEIGFFDFYIIPLAKKLKDCGVFGVSSDEYLIYATQNRTEWESKGPTMVAEMVENLSSLVPNARASL